MAALGLPMYVRLKQNAQVDDEMTIRCDKVRKSVVPRVLRGRKQDLADPRLYKGQVRSPLLATSVVPVITIALPLPPHAHLNANARRLNMKIQSCKYLQSAIRSLG